MTAQKDNNTEDELAKKNATKSNFNSRKAKLQQRKSYLLGSRRGKIEYFLYVKMLLIMVLVRFL